jgi:choline kinase
MSGHTGIVLAAGRGSRLGGITDERPKCLVELGGRALLERQIEALREGGVDSIHVVTGYRRDAIEARGVPTVHNPDWSRSNMVASLLCAVERLPAPFIASYADIVYRASLVRRLVDCPHDLAITYDLDWNSLWERRFDEPLEDAETFRVDDDGRVREIGGKAANVEEIQGQFMGLMRVTAAAVGWIVELVTRDGSRNTLDSTGMLMQLIEAGRPVHGVPTRGGWCEVDDPGDLVVAEELLARGLLRDTADPGGA